MRFWLLPLLALVAFSYAQENDQSIADITQHIIDVENQLKEELKTDLAAAKDKYNAKKMADQQKKEEFSAALKEKIDSLKKTINDKITAAKEAKQVFDAEKEAAYQQKLADLKKTIDGFKEIGAALEQEKEQKRAEKQQAIDELKAKLEEVFEQKKAEKQDAAAQASEELRKKFDELKGKAAKTKEEKAAEKQQKIDSLKATLENLKAVISAEAEKRKTAKDERIAAQTAEQQKFKDDIKAKKDALAVEAQALIDKYAEFSQKKQELTDTVEAAIDAGEKASLGEKIRDKFQSALDKEAVRRVAEEEKVAAAAFGKVPAPKASIFDELSGKSAWQTVTWILLALCILLSIALIAMILHQVAQRSKYQRLDGNDQQNERTPLAQPVAPLTYQSEKTPLTSAPAPNTPTAPSHSGGPPVYPEAQQF